MHVSQNSSNISQRTSQKNALRAAGGKFEMISPGENRIQSVLNSHEELLKIGQFFQVLIHFHLSHLQTKMIDPSFCSLEGLFVKKFEPLF